MRAATISSDCGSSATSPTKPPAARVGCGEADHRPVSVVRQMSFRNVPPTSASSSARTAL